MIIGKGTAIRRIRNLVPPAIRAPLRKTYHAIKSRGRPFASPIAAALGEVAVNFPQSVVVKAIEILPVEVLPVRTDVLRTHLLASMKKGKIENRAERLVLRHQGAPVIDQKTIINQLLNFLAPSRVAELLSLLGEADRTPSLHLAIAHRALGIGDVLTARTAVSRAANLLGATRSIELEIAEATLASMSSDAEASSAALSRIVDHPQAKFKDLLKGLSLADGICPDLIPLFLQKMQAVANGADRVIAARQLYEFGDNPSEGLRALSDLLHDEKVSESAAYWLGRYLRHSGYLPEASVILQALKQNRPSDPKPYLELAEIAIEVGKYQDALRMVRMARELSPADKVLFSPAEFTAYASTGNFRKAWELYKDRGTHKHLKDGYLQNRYTNSYKKWRSSDDRMLVAVSGLGDEIRWSCGYAHLPSTGSTVVTCDPRLLPLFERSFPRLKFLAVKRRYKVVDRVAGPQYNAVPSAELTYFFDNDGWQEALRSKRVTTMYDAISSLLPSKEAFDRKGPLLIPDPEKVEHWSTMLPTDLPKIGLSWRSDLISYARTQHYAPMDTILELIRSRRAHWYVLQSEITDQERQLILGASNGRAVFAKNICDIRSDLDNTAAFLKCMDVVIAPATANLELAGAVGTAAILMSRSKHVSWRILDESRDIWFDNVVHAHIPLSIDLDGKKLGGLVQAKLAAILGETQNA